MSSQEASHDFGDFSGSSEGLRELDELTAFLLSSDLPEECGDGPSDELPPSDSLRRQNRASGCSEDLRESLTVDAGLPGTSQVTLTTTHGTDCTILLLDVQRMAQTRLRIGCPSATRWKIDKLTSTPVSPFGNC